jgi:hypothetical protein
MDVVRKNGLLALSNSYSFNIVKKVISKTTTIDKGNNGRALELILTRAWPNNF